MKVLVLGYGSIGRRHTGLLHGLLGGTDEVAVCETAPGAADRARREGADAWRVFDDVDRSFAWGPDAVVIATPHTTHLDLACRAMQTDAAVLIEKPLSHDRDGVDVFLRRVDEARRPVRVMCNMRFHPATRAIRESLTRVGTVRFARAFFGGFLPDMRPGVDFRTIYVSDPEQGGAIRDCIQTVEYVIWMLGKVRRVTCVSARLGEFGIDVEDFAAITLEHVSGAISEIHVDYLQRYKRRGCEVIGSEGSLAWNSDGPPPERCRVSFARAGDSGWRDVLGPCEVDVNDMYREVLSRFLGIVKGDDDGSLLAPADAAHVLDVVLAARRSADLGAGVTLEVH